MEETAIKQAENSTSLEQPAKQAEGVARVLILGGVSAEAGAFTAGEALREQMAAQDLRVCALHESGEKAARWLSEAGVDILSLAALCEKDSVPALPEHVGSIGAGETQSMANRPHVLCVNGVRLGFVSLAEQAAGEFYGRADLLSLTAVDRVRMLLNQCDHVIALVHSGLPEAELPLPEWRARYRRLVEAGASVVVDSGAARGWEAYQTGLVFYGLGAPTGSDSLGLFLSLQPNGKFTYEARALQGAGTLDFSKNEAFFSAIDSQNAMLRDEKEYLSAADEMCLRLYCQGENAQKRGLMSLFSPHAEEEAKLLSLLENESLRLVTMRAIRKLRGEDRSCREIAKKA